MKIDQWKIFLSSSFQAFRGINIASHLISNDNLEAKQSGGMAMKRLATFALITTALAGLALAQTRQISLVRGTPTNYGLYGFDISWLDNSTQKYYLTDRTNNAIDLVDAATDTFLGFIAKGNFTGTRPCPDHPKDLRHCAGPNGVLTDDLGHVWAGDGVGNIIEADATKPGTAVIRKIPTGGKFLA